MTAPISSPTFSQKVSEVKSRFSKIFPKKEKSVEVTVQSVLEQGKQVVTAAEAVANRCKNITAIDLTLPTGMSADALATLLIQELSDFKKADDEHRSELPKVQGKAIPVVDILVVKTFIGELLADPQGQKLLREIIQRKDDLLHKRAYLSSSVLKAIFLMKDPQDAACIATHLMSECTKTLGAYRIVEAESLCILLKDDRIKGVSELFSAVQSASLAVMQEAIRKCQSNIVFQQIRTRLDWKVQLELWDTTAKKFGHTYFDLLGISDIAKSAGLTISVVENPQDENQQFLVLLRQGYESVLEACK